MSLEPVPRWLRLHVLPFAGTALVVIGGSRVTLRYAGVVGLWPSLAALLMAGVLYAAVAFLFVDPSISEYLKSWRRRLRALQKAPIA